MPAPRIRPRYEVRTDGRAYRIYDNRLGDYCSLAGRPLAWAGKSPAEAWLDRCYSVWEFRPLVGDEPTPRKYWGRPGRRVGTDRSPWEGWSVPNSDSMFGR